MKKLSLLVFLLFSFVATTFAQRTVTGTITDSDGVPLIGASVLAQGTTVGTITDIDGSFSLNVPDGTSAIEVSYTGYDTQVVDITSSSNVTVALSEGQLLDEVVVTALGIERDQKSIGYAATNLDGESLSRAKETNVVNALSGKIAGVQVAGAPSSLGGSSRVTIRGNNSFLGNNQPLFVVDGIPIDNGNRSNNPNGTDSGQGRGFGGSIAYDYGNAAQDIDPENIESMTVLKGAAATALYGTRGANGVIQITTKKGKENSGLGIEVSTQMSFDKVRNLIPHQQQYGGGDQASTESGFYEVTQDGVTYLTPAYAKDGAWGPKYDPNVQVRHWDSWDPNNSATYKETRPWVAPSVGYENFFETGVTRTTNVALVGGNDKGTFRLGFTNLGSTGTLPNGSLDRNTFNINSTYNLSDRLNVGLTGSYINTNASGRNITGYNNGNPLQAFNQWWQTQIDVDRLEQGTYQVNGDQQTWNSIGASVDSDGNLLNYNAAPNFFDNPYWARENYLQNDNRKRLIGGATLSYDLGGGFSVLGRATTDIYNTFDEAGIPIQSVETAIYRQRDESFAETNFEARLSYQSQLTDRISLNAFVGGNNMKQRRHTATQETNGGLALEGFFNISNSVAPASFDNYLSERAINSIFGSASFGFDNWAYLDVTARNDWSSTLPPDHSGYFYPAVTASAVISELMDFDYNTISFLKLRASYANAGNDARPYSITDVYDPQAPNFGNFARYSVPNSRNNPNLKPEFTTEIEFGADAKFFANRMGVDIAYFSRSTVDQIFAVPSSSTTGYSSILLNAGEMKNSGVELAITGRPVQTKDFAWDLGLNVSKINNEVVSLADSVESINMGGTWAADLRIQKGEKYMAIYGQDYLYHENGERLVDESGAYMFTDDRVYLGSAMPDVVGGFNTAFTYKGITLGALFDFQFGGVMHSTSLQWSKYSGMHPETVEYEGQTDIRENGMILNGVKADGSPNDVAIDPQLYYQTYWRRAAPNIYSTDFVKLRELRLSYKLADNLVSKAGIRDFSIGLMGRNLAILHKDIPYLDPQVISGAGNRQGLENAQVPPTSSIGINISFKL